MPARTPTTRYLERYAEPQARYEWPFDTSFDHVVVVPAFDETRDFIDAALARPDAASWLLIVVANARSDAAPSAIARTEQLLNLNPGSGFHAKPTSSGKAWQATAGRRGVWLVDAVSPAGRFDARQGVGLARKIGLDLALAQIVAGRIDNALMRCTDADATWPANYFDHEPGPDISAVTFGFRHTGALASSAAQIVYDQRLRDYPRELTRAGSPYGFQALGSAMAISAVHYAQASGCPTRQAGEDFHLLAKLAKLGQIEHRPETVVELRARHSERVPFGTGPGVRRLDTQNDPTSVPFFFATRSFDFLGQLIATLKRAVLAPSRTAGRACLQSLIQDSKPDGLSDDLADVLGLNALIAAIERARSASADPERRVQHIMTWFDALRTLRLLHRLRDAGWANVSYQQLRKNEPARLARGADAGQEEVPAEALGSSSSTAEPSEAVESDSTSAASD